MSQPNVIEFQPLPPIAATPRWMFWTGWVLSALIGIFFLYGGAMALATPHPDMQKGMETVGWPVHHMKTIGLIEIARAALYLLPWTAGLGAILFTGFFGGAVATHLRVQDGMWFVPVIFGAVVWLGLFLRDARVRALIPLRR